MTVPIISSAEMKTLFQDNTNGNVKKGNIMQDEYNILFVLCRKDILTNQGEVNRRYGFACSKETLNKQIVIILDKVLKKNLYRMHIIIGPLHLNSVGLQKIYHLISASASAFFLLDLIVIPCA